MHGILETSVVISMIPRTPRRGRRFWLRLPCCAAIALVAALASAVPGPLAAPGRTGALPLDGRWVRGTLAGSINTLLADPHRAGVLLAGTADGIWRSAGGGSAWSRDGGSPGGNVFALAESSGTGAILAGASDGRVYARSGTAAGHWQAISPPLSADPVFSLAVAPDGRSALAGTLGVLYQGQETGSTWQWRPVRGSNGTAITSIVWAPWDTHLVFATVFHATPSVLASHDGGRTWQPDERGLPPNLPTQSLHTGGAATRDLVLSTMGGGVWLRAPSGVWHDISAGLPQRHAMPIAGDPSGNGALFAGTMGRGVYEKQGQAAWRPLGHGLQGLSGLVLALLAPSVAQPALLAGTGQGLFRYVPSSADATKGSS